MIRREKDQKRMNHMYMTHYEGSKLRRSTVQEERSDKEQTVTGGAATALPHCAISGMEREMGEEVVMKG